MEKLIQDLIDQGYLKTPEIIEAFRTIKRADFLPDELKRDASLNIPLPIGYGQTISQPLTVAFMLELLGPKKGEKILDVGSGSAWTTALLAHLTGPEGRVFAIERIPQLKTYGEDNLKKYSFTNVEVFCGDGVQGLSEFAPFDKIQVAAAAGQIPTALLDQLAVGGRLVIPVGDYSQDMVLIKKNGEKDFQEEGYPGFQFVPLIKGE